MISDPLFGSVRDNGDSIRQKEKNKKIKKKIKPLISK